MRMGRNSSRYWHHLVFLLILSVGMMVEAETCYEDSGNCDGSCNATCAAKHPGGNGCCVPTDPGVVVCRCSYECDSPPKRRCTTGLCRCSAKCNEQCCDTLCHAKHPDGNGYCDDSLGPANSVCVCAYGC